MKKFFTFLSIISLIPKLTHAQFELIGGNMLLSTYSRNTPPGFDNQSLYSSSGTSIGINPTLATFYKPTALRGIGIIYNYYQASLKTIQPIYNYNYNYKVNTQSVGLNLFWQRFISLGNNLFFTIYTGGAVLYNYSKQTDLTGKAVTKSTGYTISAGVAPGISYKINSRFLFDASLDNLLYAGYQHLTTTNNYPLPQETKTHDNSFNLSSSLSNTSLGNIGLGFRWFLHKR